jgi:predicted transcriptional regulator
VQITLELSDEIIRELDEAAERLHMTREDVAVQTLGYIQNLIDDYEYECEHKHDEDEGENNPDGD